MNKKVRLKRNVYLIIAGVLMLALAVQLSKAEFVLRFSRNEALTNEIKQWKPALPEHGALPEHKAPYYCIPYADTNTLSVKVKDHVVRILGYMKKSAKPVNVLQEPFRPEGCSSVIVTVERLELLGEPEVLADYVKNGGYSLLAVHPEPGDAFYQMYRKMGIIRAGDYADTSGIELTSSVLIGEMGKRHFDGSIANTSLSVELDPQSRVMAKTSDGIPLLWEADYGKGKFMVFNGTMLQEKINRGLLAGAISKLEPDFIYPIFNVKLFYIDDFPAPIPPGLNVDIYRTYRRDIPAFYKEIWWPDMLKAAKRYDLKYTAVLIESYSDRVDPPFETPQDADSKGLISYGREVIKSGGEIGLHGYNHQSLQTSAEVANEFGYKAWSGVETITESIAEARRFFASAFPKYSLLSYVPPSNVLGPEGREALKKGLPDIAIISSLYGEDATGRSYVQEYEIAPDGILEMPRLTSGYSGKPFDSWVMANGITAHGIFSHFVHPDDILDRKRGSNQTWENLYEAFTKMLDRLETQHPWLRPTTSTEAAIEIESVLNSSVSWKRDENSIAGTIEPFRSPKYFVLRTSGTILGTADCKATQIDEGTYLVTALKADFKIEMGE